MKIIKWKFWTVKDVKEHPNYLFIFGDNDIKKGKKGQAIIRDQPNALGIPTKKLPSLAKKAYYSDDEYESNKLKIDQAIELILFEAPEYDVLVLPEDGLGTGLSDLANKAPKTYQYLNEAIKKLSTLHINRGPLINSKQVKLNTTMMGLDGNLYQSVKTKSGTTKWILIKNNTIDNTVDNSNVIILPDQLKWTIYGTSGCKFCRLAIELLKNRQELYVYHDISDKREKLFQTFNKELQNYKTIPVIFYHGEFVGGYNELKKTLDAWELEEQLIGSN